MDINYKDIGKRIRAERIRKSVSQSQLAEMTGLSVTHMSHIETANTKLSLPALVAIANALNVSTDAFLFDNVTAAKVIPHNQIAEVLEASTPSQTKILADIIIAAKISLDRNME